MNGLKRSLQRRILMNLLIYDHRKVKYSCFVEWSAKALKAEKTYNNTR